MAIISLEKMQQHGLVMSVARALAITNQTAQADGTDPDRSLVTITEERPADRHTQSGRAGRHQQLRRSAIHRCLHAPQPPDFVGGAPVAWPSVNASVPTFRAPAGRSNSKMKRFFC